MVTLVAMRILAVFAHPDDELGCIGSLIKHAERGDDVMLVWTTHGEMASQFADHSHEEVRRIRQEHGSWVAKKVGAEAYFFDMGDSRMTADRNEGLALARLYSRFKPDAVLTWSDDHPHPDHRMTAKISFDALTLARIPKIINEDSSEVLEAHRKNVRFFQYISSAYTRPIMHIDITEQIDLASEIFAFYQSFYAWDYSPERYREVRALTGREVGVKYAEKFHYRNSYAPAFDYLV